MNTEDLLQLYEYNYWANRRILSAAEKVSAAQLAAPSSFPFGSLRGTLVHIMDAEYGWRTFFKENNWSAPDLKEADFPTLASIQTRWKQEEQAMRAFLATLHDADLAAYRHYTNEKGEPRDRLLWHCLWHVVNHGTQHRSEAAALLTDYGASPGNLDFTVYLIETQRA